jgi:tRNA-2-methylthio-N6-dimethylallyladenosine synthase
LKEVRELAALGYSEVQLLGQTVNSYADPSPKKLRFADLLLAVADVPAIRRVRFTTSHPRDFSRDIVEAIESEPKLCNHVHLPVQSGSSRVLSAMKRTYSRGEYLERVAMMRGAKRPISITTDIIVGFPGETAEEFDETLTLMNEVRYEGVYSFKYSPRPNTASLAMGDTVSEDEKSRRLSVLQQRQREIQTEHNLALAGSTFEVMVSGKSKRERYWTGHTTCNRVLAFTSQESDLLGTYIPVRITDASQSSLNGEHVR